MWRERHELRAWPGAWFTFPQASKVSEALATEAILIAGNEGGGISLELAGTSLRVPQEPGLESLNVAQAVTIALFARYCEIR